MEQGANNLHMVQLMPLPPHHLLLHLNPESFASFMPAYSGCPGKTQREPTRHSVVLDCKLLPLHNTCQSLSAVCYITCGKDCVSQCENLGGGAKTRQTFTAVSWPKFTNFGGNVGESL